MWYGMVLWSISIYFCMLPGSTQLPDQHWLSNFLSYTCSLIHLGIWRADILCIEVVVVYGAWDALGLSLTSVSQIVGSLSSVQLPDFTAAFDFENSNFKVFLLTEILNVVEESFLRLLCHTFEWRQECWDLVQGLVTLISTTLFWHLLNPQCDGSLSEFWDLLCTWSMFLLFCRVQSSGDWSDSLGSDLSLMPDSLIWG